jgi:hypothetical protein
MTLTLILVLRQLVLKIDPILLLKITEFQYHKSQTKGKYNQMVIILHHPS